jgi:hypothetical protein
MVRGRPHGSRCKVAAQAILIVGTRIAHEPLVWIVAGHASEASVPFLSPASALFQAIRLCAYVGHPHEAGQLDVPPGAMAGTAKVNNISRVQLAGIEDQACLLSGFLRDDVIEPRSVTRFTGDTGYDSTTVELVVDRRGSRMAGETTDELSARYRPRHGLLKILWLWKAAARREIESFQSVEVRNAAFVEISVPLEEIRLANMTVAERPGQWSGDAMRTIRDRVNLLAFCAGDLVTDSARLKSQPTVSGQNARVSPGGGGARHGRILLRRCFPRMTFSALRRSNVFSSGRSAVSWPPTAIEEPVLCSHLRLQRTGRRGVGREK